MMGYPSIDRLPGDAPRPFWSVMIPTYNPHPEYLEQTLAAVLAQDPGPATMEIAVIDDCSGFVDPRALRVAGRNRISWFRQERHVGIGRNWNTCVRRARGRWVHILHQDDVVRAGFYERLREGIEAAPAAGAAFCRDVVIDGQGRRKWSQPVIRTTPGIVEDWIDHVFAALHLRASALVVKRSVYEALGGFRLDLQYALDWDMWKRVAVAYPLWYEPEELACCRRHAGGASFRSIRSGTNIAEIRRSIELSEASLPPAIGADVTKRARETYTRYAVVTAWRALMERDLPASLAQIREARGLTSSLAVALAIGRLLARVGRVAR